MYGHGQEILPKLSYFGYVCMQKGSSITIIGAVYHPPKPLYRPTVLLDCIESAIVALQADFPTATVVLAGDFNTLEDSEVISRGALDSVVNRPTRGTSMLDRIYVSHPCYENVPSCNINGQNRPQGCRCLQWT